MREYLNALWELTKRELRRKYARSYLGILWSSLYPFLRMSLGQNYFHHDSQPEGEDPGELQDQYGDPG